MKEVFTSGLQVLEGCYCLRAAAAYVRGFQAFIEGNFQDAKANLRETIRLSHEEELNRLSTSAYITLGQIQLNERNTQVSILIFTPTEGSVNIKEGFFSDCYLFNRRRIA